MTLFPELRNIGRTGRHVNQDNLLALKHGRVARGRARRPAGGRVVECAFVAIY